MKIHFSPELTVCGIDELTSHSARNVTHVLSIIDPDRPALTEFSGYGDHSRTTLRFHDIIAEQNGHILPTQQHVEEILAFGQSFLDSRDDETAAHILVHCHMGVSRSTAAMLTLMAQANPDETAQALFLKLVEIRPQAWPNSRMIAFADEQLGRKGELSEQLKRHYGRQLKAQPQFRDWMASLGRGAEVEMAVEA
ncbi:dual specificity protein phosphatase family protein [Rhizobium sp. RM]|uniref:tyrosine phosphatase family protein n=1 Tax=Rhizobium sp. RM TaxID=2748079 RepID=UPI00110D36C7|nr:dual specificity protein phosphatase family protein [Rhizobium sp. RM]NWJ26042.1 dual specificity protein phosphatase family protein [Rhizobium sp. RM]TMV20649.1 protein-tyrosine-phosphatase [Rhizobium sp. Td3]